MRITSFIAFIAIFSLATSPAPSKASSRIMLAAKKKKKKAKSTEGDGFGMEGIDAIEDTDSGVGIHRDQEGVDTPYVVELGGATSLLQLDSKASGIQEKRWSRKIEVEGHICMRFGKFFIGPEIGILSGIETRKYDETTATVQSSDNEAINYSAKLGPLMRLFFHNVDTAANLPFIYSGLAYKRQFYQYKVNGDLTEKLDQSGYEIKLGGGLGLMLDSNIAAAARAEYFTDQLQGKPKDATENIKTSTSGPRIFFELMTFL